MKRILTGTVFSDKMDKTIVVMIERLVKHSTYNRTIRRRNKFKVHDEKNEAHAGDKVKIEEYRPVSKTKRWRLIEVLKKEGHK